MAPLWHHVHHFRKTMTVKHFRRETGRTLNGVSTKAGARLHKRVPLQKGCGSDTTICQSLYKLHSHMHLLAADTEYLQCSSQRCQPMQDKRPGPPGNLAGPGDALTSCKLPSLAKLTPKHLTLLTALSCCEAKGLQ